MYKRKLGCSHVDGSLYDFNNYSLNNEYNIKHSKSNDINESNIVGIVLALLGFLDLFASLGYGLYVLYGWLVSSIFK